jgi:hypothetical protein
MNSQRIPSIFASVIICFILVMAINPNTYRALFGAENVEFPGGLECIINMGVYPLAGLLFSFFERKSKINELAYLAGGAISSVFLFFLFDLGMLLLYPNGFIEAVNQTVAGFKLVYTEKNIFGITGMLIGFIYLIFMISLMGGTSSFLLSMIIKEENEIVSSNHGT